MMYVPVYAPHLSFTLLIIIMRAHISPLDPFIYLTVYFPGLGRQSQVSLAPFSSRWTSHGSEA